MSETDTPDDNGADPESGLGKKAIKTMIQRARLASIVRAKVDFYRSET